MRPLSIGLAILLASCGAPQRSVINVTDVWAQPLSAVGKSAAVYATIMATCTGQDVLQSVKAPAPEEASLHISTIVDDVLQISPLRSVVIPCGKLVRLKPMAEHIMIIGIRKPLGIGDRLPLILNFEGTDVPVEAEVTTLAVLENVDPMHMHRKRSGAGMTNMDHMSTH